MRFFIIITLILGLFTYISGQAPTTQDCLGAIPVCTEVYVENTAPSGFGTFANEVNNVITCLDNDNNAIWYTFTVNSSGDFGFVLTPNDPNDDYDWAMWDLTNNSCADIENSASFMVSCNAAGGSDCHGPTGATGGSIYGLQGGGCSANPPNQFGGFSPFNELIPVVAGNTYVLLVSNWTGSTNGYEIDFGLSQDIGIFDQTYPFVKGWRSNATPGCLPTQFEIEFSEAIQCATITASNFQIKDDRDNSYTVALSSENCNIGGAFSRFFVLDILDPLIETGTYLLIMRPSNNSDILDLCDNPTSYFVDPFQFEGLQNIEWPTDTLICDVSSFSLSADDPNATSYLWQDGSTSSNYEITNSGTYNVTIANDCESRDASINITFEDLPLTFTLSEQAFLCPEENLAISAIDANGEVYEWSNGVNTPEIIITQGGTYTVEVSNRCEIRTQTIEVIEDSCVDCKIYVPNAFRMTGAQNPSNELFAISSNCLLSNYNLQIFDRWGSIQFQSSDSSLSWKGEGRNGQIVLPGIYTYALQYSYVEFGQIVSEEQQGNVLFTR